MQTAAEHPRHSNEWFNAKYGAFIVTRYSSAQGRSIQVGKVCGTVQEAHRKIRQIETRSGEWLTHFIDIAPSALAKAQA